MFKNLELWESKKREKKEKRKEKDLEKEQLKAD